MGHVSAGVSMWTLAVRHLPQSVSTTVAAGPAHGSARRRQRSCRDTDNGAGRGSRYPGRGQSVVADSTDRLCARRRARGILQRSGRRAARARRDRTLTAPSGTRVYAPIPELTCPGYSPGRGLVVDRHWPVRRHHAYGRAATTHVHRQALGVDVTLDSDRERDRHRTVHGAGLQVGGVARR